MTSPLFAIVMVVDVIVVVVIIYSLVCLQTIRAGLAEIDGEKTHKDESLCQKEIPTNTKNIISLL